MSTYLLKKQKLPKGSVFLIFCLNLLSGAVSHVLSEGNSDQRVLSCGLQTGSNYLRSIKQRGCRSIYYSRLKRLLKHDQNTIQHCQRVAEISLQIASKLDLPQDQIKELGRTATLHDIGKIFIPKTILNFKGELTPAEWEIIKLHPVKGAEITRQESAPPEVISGILHHHEHYGGWGYPHCLKGKEIPLLSRMIAVADAYDAMTNPRPYRSQALSVDMALSEIQIHAGPQFDPDIVDALIELMKGSAFIEKTKVLRL